MAGKIEFVINKKGEVTVEGVNCTGQECSVMSKPFEEALGVEVSKSLKPEYYVELDGEQVKVSEE